jgi:hypothetical protein
MPKPPAASGYPRCGTTFRIMSDTGLCHDEMYAGTPKSHHHHQVEYLCGGGIPSFVWISAIPAQLGHDQTYPA